MSDQAPSSLANPARGAPLGHDESIVRQRAEARLSAQVQQAASEIELLTRARLEALLQELEVYQVELEMQNEELRHAQIALEAARKGYADLYDQAPVGYLTVSDTGLIQQINLTATMMFDAAHDDLIQTPMQQFIANNDRDAYYLLCRLALTSAQARTGELCMVKHSGGQFWAELTITAVHDQTGTAVLRVVLSDITERKASREKLELAASVFANAREAIMITDIQGNIVDVNAAFVYITGYSREEVLGRNPSMLSSDRQTPQFYIDMWRDLVEKGHWYGEIWNRRKNGEVFAELETITTVRNAAGQPSHYVALFSDITSYKEHQVQLEHIAH